MSVVWITGLPQSGKSTLARRVVARLRESGRQAVLLDGDEVRDALVPRPGYSERERDTFYATLTRLAGMLSAQGLAVIVAATAHERRWRDEARASSQQFVEVFVDAPLAECKRRDTKSLYAQAPRELPGAGVPYEAPLHPEVTAHGGDDRGAMDRILELV